VKQFRLDIPPEQAHRFVAALEALIASDLTHPGIAAPQAAGLEQDTPYLAQDFVAAEAFDVVVRDYGPAPVADALRVATQLGGALDFAAAVDVWHGSLHPRDVLVSADETRVTGLGIAQALRQIEVASPVRRPYTAPERLAGEAWDRRADIFSLAALVYEMLFGRRIAGYGPEAVDAIVPPEGSDVGVLRDLFARALAERPEDRFDTALAFADALHGALGTLTSSPRPPRTKRRRDTDPAIARAVASYRATRPARQPEPELPLISAAEAEDLPLTFAGPDEHADIAIAPDSAGGDVPVPVDPSGEADGPAGGAAMLDELSFRDPVDDGPRKSIDLLAGDADAPYDASTHEPADREDVSAPGADTPPPGDLDASARPGSTFSAPPTASDETASGTLSSVALEQTRSAVWPLVLALVVGVALGFAFGYSVGTRERPDEAATAARSVPAAAGEAPQATQTAPARPTDVPLPSSSAPGASGAAASPAGTSRTEGATPATGGAGGGTPAERRSTQPGRIAVRSTPSGARVSLDGREVGATPVTVRDLAPGLHVVRIAHQGYVTAERRVRIRTAQPAQSIEVVLAEARPARQAAPRPTAPDRTSGVPPGAPNAKAGSLMVDSRPAGARVFVDGRMVGTTPLLLDSVPAGEHAVRLEMAGFAPWSSAATVTGGERTRVSGSLEPR